MTETTPGAGPVTNRQPDRHAAEPNGPRPTDYCFAFLEHAGEREHYWLVFLAPDTERPHLVDEWSCALEARNRDGRHLLGTHPNRERALRAFGFAHGDLLDGEVRDGIRIHRETERRMVIHGHAERLRKRRKLTRALNGNTHAEALAAARRVMELVAGMDPGELLADVSANVSAGLLATREG